MAFAETATDFLDTDGLDAVAATFGALTATGYLDAPDELLLGGRVNSTDYSFLYPASGLAGLTNGSALTVDGVAYTVRGEPRSVDDGRWKRVFLSKN